MAPSEPLVQPTPEQAAQLAKLDALASRPQLPNAKSLLLEAWTLFRANFWRLLGISALGFLPMLAVPFAFIGGMTAGSVSSGFLVAGIMLAIALCIAVWSGAASLIAVLRPETAKGILPAFQAVRAQVPAFLWIAALQSMLAFGGLFLFFVGSIILSVFVSFAPLLLLDKDVRGMKALLTSRELVRGRVWRVMGYFLLIGFTLTVANLVWSGIPALFGASKDTMELFNSIFNVIAGPFAVCYQVSLYRHVTASAGDTGIVPKPGQAKWYWIVVALGPIMFALIATGVFAAYKVQSKFYGDMIGADELRQQLESQYADFGDL